MQHKAGMDSEGQTVETFYTTLQIMFYFQKGKKSPWMDRELLTKGIILSNLQECHCGFRIRNR